MTTKVYTVGYGGRKPHEIADFVTSLDAVLFDVRYNPWSSYFAFSRPQLEKQYGPRYKWVKYLGNAAAREGGIRIADLDAGIELIRQSDRPVILMCGCKDPAGCHRTIIAARLRDLGFEVTELNQPAQDKPAEPQPVQLPLF